MKKLFFFFLSIYSYQLYAQKPIQFTQQDTLRGTINADRIWWDLQHYELKLSIDIDQRRISGTNKVTYKVISSSNQLQIDLQNPMKITEVVQDEKRLAYHKNGNVYIIDLQKEQIKDSINKLTIHFSGNPKSTKGAPWKAGFTWEKDSNGIDFIGTSCQGQGASIWWPCKDHLYDEPDKGMDYYYTVPFHLFAVGNGRLIKETVNKNQNTKTFHWKVLNPINNYGVQLSIGDYVTYHDSFEGEAGTLDCDYYILKESYPKAKKQLKEVERTLRAFEYWFGPYPFYEDSYKIVEVPYLGMEHQSAVGYGNNYENGYRGTDLSGSGWGLKFDFIIVHESGHEWFGNNITNKDIADMWIHESFTNYSETLFLNYHFGKVAGSEYVIGLRENIQNDKPIIGNYDVNNEGSGDMYYKGANMLHTIRSIIRNDNTWRSLLRGLNSSFYHQTVTTQEIENYINDAAQIDFSKVFDQYLRTVDVPNFQYKIKNKRLEYRWTNCIEDFDMPLLLKINNKLTKIQPTTSWNKLVLKQSIKELIVDENFYVTSENLRK